MDGEKDQVVNEQVNLVSGGNMRKKTNENSTSNYGDEDEEDEDENELAGDDDEEDEDDDEGEYSFFLKKKTYFSIFKYKKFI